MPLRSTRHLRPKNKLQKVKDSLNVGLEECDIPISITVSVLETEAWFIKEASHFEKIDEILTIEHIANNTGLDISVVAAEDINAPAETLNSIYNLVGLEYKKKNWQVQLTVQNLDYLIIYDTLKAQIAALGEFVDSIDDFLDMPAVNT